MAQLTSTLCGVAMALATALAASGPCLAQHPPTAVMGSGEAGPVQSNREWTTCQRAQQDIQRDHGVIHVPGMAPMACDPANAYRMGYTKP